MAMAVLFPIALLRVFVQCPQEDEHTEALVGIGRRDILKFMDFNRSSKADGTVGRAWRQLERALERHYRCK